MRSDSNAAFRRQVAHWARRLNVQPSGVYLQPMTRKWASCSTSGRLSFSLRLLRQPPAFRRQVIIHELLHLRIRNHGPLFRALLRAHCPNLPPFPCALSSALAPRPTAAARSSS